MIENEQEHIPAGVLVKYCLEEHMLAIREKRRVPESVLSFEHFLARMLSDELDLLYSHIDRKQLKTIFREIYSFSEYAARTINVLASIFLRLQDEFLKNPAEFKPQSFEERLIDAYEAEKMIKSDSPSFATRYSKLKQDPIPGLFKTLWAIIVERRILRRYIRTRFGVIWGKVRTHQKRSYKRKKPFYEWLQENEPDRFKFQTEQIQTAYRKYVFSLDNERHLRHYAESRLSHLDTEFTLWKSAVLMSFDHLVLVHDGANFSVKEFAADILRGIEPAIEELPIGFHAAVIQTKKEFSLKYEEDLLKLSASIAAQLSSTVNRNLEKTLNTEPRMRRDTLLERIPGSVLIAMDDKGRSKTKLHSKVANLICEELRLSDRHDARLERRIRDDQKKRDGVSQLGGTDSSYIVAPEDLPALQEQDFALREEARIDLHRIVRRANLSIGEKEVYSLRMEGLKELEIAEKLGKRVGTIKSLYHRARTKILKNTPK